MGIWDIFTNNVSTNVGMGIENIILLILLLGSILFIAKHFQIGMIILLLFSSGLFIIFYRYSLNYTPFLVVAFMSLVILILSLYASSKAVREGTII